MDVLEMRVPEYVGRARMESAPQSCAVKKPEYIKSRKEVIVEIDHKISDLTKQLEGIQDKEGVSYQNIVKVLKKCYEIKQNCEISIVLAREQMKTNKR